MMWKRGLLLAAIHVAIAIAMILLVHAELHCISDRSRTEPVASLRLAAWQEEEQTVSFSPCDFYGRPNPPETVVMMVNPFVEEVVGWAEFCPVSWTLAGRLGLKAKCGSVANPTLAAALCIFIFVQWFLIGSFPLIRPKRWWLEPGAFISLCACLGAAICLIPAIDALARLPTLIAFVAWLLWLGLLLWRILQLAWRLILRGWRSVTASAA